MAFSYSHTRTLAAMQLRAGLVPLIIGPPGVGKTAMHSLLASDLDLPAEFFNPSDYEAHEIGGVLCPDGDKVRKLFAEGSPLLRACNEAVLLGIDEFNAQGPSKFASMARICNERLVGDRKLHPGTRVVCYTNSQSQSLEGNDLPLPSLNRMAPIELAYSVADFQAFLANYGAVDSQERKYAEQLSAMLEFKPGLLEIDPSRMGADGTVSFVAEIVASNSTWASPRAWERLIQFRAEAARQKSVALKSVFDEHKGDVFACIIGPRQATVYSEILNTGKELPSVSEIAETPLTCKLPTNNIVGLSLAALLPLVGKRCAASAWLYVDRFNSSGLIGGEETARQLYKTLVKCCPLGPTDSPEARKVMAKLAASIRGGK